jgi:NAD(P)-dependent dehydrogenase (short-subunit alcohol dehydrogenase family)
MEGDRRGAHCHDEPMDDGAARPVLLTGGTSGLGLQTVGRLAGAGVPVLATGRDVAGAPEITGVQWTPLDLADRGSVASLARAVPPLRALVANAGSQFADVRTTPGGWDATFAVNHLGHVDLICALLATGHLQRGSRIVLVASGTHDPAVRTGMPDPRLTSAEAAALDVYERGTFAARRRYTTSKLANVMTAFVLARRLQGHGITVTAFDPGLMPGTGLARDGHPALRALWRTGAHALRVLPGVTSPAASARTLAALATGEAWEGRTGIYVSLDRERAASVQARDVAAQDRLWTESLALLGVDRDPTAVVPAAV